MKDDVKQSQDLDQASTEQSVDAKPIKIKRKSRKKRSKKRSKKKRKVVETPFGTVIQNMDSKQKKVLNQLVFSATDSSHNAALPNSVLGVPQQGKQLPQYDTKKNHLLTKGIGLEKNMQTGEWEIGYIETNHGRFGTGKEQTEQINQTLVRTFVSYLKGIFEGELKTFLDQEQE